MDNRYLVIPVYNTVILPQTNAGLNIPELSRQERQRITRDGYQVILMGAKRPGKLQDSSELQEYGVFATVRSFGVSQTGSLIHAVLHERVRLLDAAQEEGMLIGSFTPAPEVIDLAPEAQERVLEEIRQSVQAHPAAFGSGSHMGEMLQGVHSVNEAGVLLGSSLQLTAAQKSELLAADRLGDRARLIREALARVVDNAQQSTAKSGAAGTKKDYRKLIEEAGMPDEVRTEVDRTLNRYLESQPNDPERSTLEAYLDFVTDLKWKIDETPELDLARARDILNRDHYGLDKVKERILQQIAVMSLKKDQAGSILLLVGAPGTGKTSMGRSVAEALGRKYVRISLGGVRDEAEIRGHRRTYVGAMPGRIMDGIRRSGAMNPVVVLDEIDKLGAGYNGDPASALLEVLDPEQNATFTDHYLNVPYDLSNVFFICTANSVDTIPGPLFDRMEVISLSGYTPMEKQQIARKYLLPRALKDAGLSEQELSVEDAALSRVIEEYTMEAGVRGLKKQLDILSRHRAAEVVENGSGPCTVGPDDIPKYLGNKRVIHDRILPAPQPGVVTGLAWTPVGGEILFIETRAMKGTGQMIVTGQLGDVMKESARIAWSLVKSYVGDDERYDMSGRDIHIHVPSGSVKKDGPSAGVTLFTALLSLVTGKPASNELAMTGEVSLRGQVMPIGGLPEKLMAADRAGITRVLIPRDNLQDLEDVPKETRAHLNIVPVDTVADVAREALQMELGAPSGFLSEQGEERDGEKN